MKIGIFTVPMEKIGTGSGSHLYYFCKAMIEEAKEHELFFIHYKKNDIDLYTRVNEIIIPKRPLIQDLAIRKLGLDILHFGMLSYKYPIWLTGTKQVVTIHGGAELSLPFKYHGSIKGYINKRFLQPVLLLKFKSIFTSSENSRSLLHKMNYYPMDHIVPVYNAVDPVFSVRSDISKSLKKYGINGPYIFHLSHYMKRKNPFVMLRAFSEVVRQGNFNSTLVIGGKGWDNIYVRNFLSEQKIEDRVKITGFIPTDDMINLYSGAQLFMFPSLYEGFGIPILEAMSCGCPVITSNVAAIPEVAGDAALLLENPLDYQEIKDAILRLVTDAELRKQCRKRGLEQAGKFSWNRSARIALDTYSMLISDTK